LTWQAERRRAQPFVEATRFNQVAFNAVPVSIQRTEIIGRKSMTDGVGAFIKLASLFHILSPPHRRDRADK
jgi:hypothetical protein